MNVKRDGHIHSHYCPHGSNDSFESYIKKAIEEGIEEITFTEHMPMPKGIVLEGASSDFLETSSPGIEEIDEYFKEENYYKEDIGAICIIGYKLNKKNILNLFD